MLAKVELDVVRGTALLARPYPLPRRERGVDGVLRLAGNPCWGFRVMFPGLNRNQVPVERLDHMRYFLQRAVDASCCRRLKVTSQPVA